MPSKQQKQIAGQYGVRVPKGAVILDPLDNGQGTHWLAGRAAERAGYLAFIRERKKRKLFHYPGGQDHDQSDHGNWADGREARDESYFAGWSDKDKEIVTLGDQIGKHYKEPHLIHHVGKSIGVAKVEKALAARKQTEAAALMKDGKLMHFFNGGPSSVKIPDAVKTEGMTLIHNHPASASLSMQDVVSAAKDQMAEIKAVTNFGGAKFTFSIKPNGAWPQKEEIARIYKKHHDALLPVFAEKRDRERAPSLLDRATGKKGYTREQLNYAASHAIIKAMARELGLKYEVKRWS